MSEIIYYDALTPVCHTYDNEIKELCQILNNVEIEYELKKKRFNEFTEKFTTPLRLWNSLISLEESHHEELNGDIPFDEQRIKDIYKKAMKHFPFTYCLTESDKMQSQINCYSVFLKSLMENAFCYERCMSADFNFFWDGMDLRYVHFNSLFHKVNITKLESLKKMEEITGNLNIYSKLAKIEYKGNYKELLEALKKQENPEYIIKNIEQNLLSYYSRKKLWKIYFHYCKKNNLKKLLNAYRSYCRLFVDDLFMRKKYRKTIKLAEKYFDTSEWIIDSIKFESDFVSDVSANKMIKKEFQKKIDISFTNNFHENFNLLKNNLMAEKNIHEENKSTKKILFQIPRKINQNYSLSKPLMNYLIKNAYYNVMQKLQYSSKELFIFTNKILCLKLSLTDDLDKTEIHEEALFISAKNPNINKINNIFVANTLFVHQEQTNAITNFIPKIARCDLRYLMLYSQILNLNEYIFLVKSGNIQGISLHYTTINKKSKERASLEELMENLSKAEILKFTPSPFINYETFKSLIKIERKVKIKRFNISPITEKFDPLFFCSFLKKVASNNATFYILHQNEVDGEYLRQYVDQLIDNWLPSSEKPIVHLSYRSYFNAL